MMRLASHGTADPHSVHRHIYKLIAFGVLFCHTHSARAQDSLPALPAARVTATYDGAAFADVAGGIHQGTTYLGALSLELTLGGQQLVGWAGSSVYLYALQTHGDNPSSLAGDAQGVSNLAAPTGLRLEEAWFQQNLFRNRLSILAGRYDLNSEFDRLQAAGLFVNSSFGIGPAFSQSGRRGPSIFPFTAVGTRIVFKPSRNLLVRTAVLDGVPVDRADGSVRIFAPGDGLLLVGEAVLLSRPATDTAEGQSRNQRFRIGRGRQPLPYNGKLAIGAWHYTASFDDLTDTLRTGRPVQHSGSNGFYVNAGQTVWSQRSNTARTLTVFGQLGTGDPRVNQFGSYTGGGLTMTAPLPGHDQDEVGLAVAAAHNGSRFTAQQLSTGLVVAGSETTLELTYLAQIASWIAVQPDVQYVINPGTDPVVRNALTAAVRFELSR